MLTIKEKGILIMITDHCDRILSKMNCTYEKASNDKDIAEIICFNMLQIGELANKFSKDFLEQHDKVPWARVVGLRNRIVHGYSSIDFEVIWQTATEDIDILKTYCESIINNDN